MPAAVAFLAVLLVTLNPSSARADDGERLYDLGPRWSEAGGGPSPHDIPVELVIAFFTDCTEADRLSPPVCGSPPAQWVGAEVPVEFCSFQSNRPSSITAQEFRDAIEAAAAAWNAAGAAVGIDYTGDCSSGSTWQDGNGRNEFGFDDGGNVVSTQSAGITLGTWRTVSLPGNSLLVVAREFIEADIVIDHRLDIPDVCFLSTLTHELGHAIGFGHSDSTSDLMFPSFNPNNVSTCPVKPSGAEISQLRALYGTDLLPSVDAGSDLTVDLGTQVTLAAKGSDPEGATLTYRWSQLSGQPVTPSAGGAGKSVVFTAPSAETTLEFEVTALDPFLHPATDRVRITVSSTGGVPTSFPLFDSFLPVTFAPGIPEGTTALGWTTVDGASSYEFCSGVSAAALASNCSTLSSPSAPITWHTVLGAGGSADVTRVLTSGWRMTRIQACSSQGCSKPSDGPLAGGVRWAAWGIDYDVIAIPFDIAGFQFTLAAVINVSGPARSFELGNGPPGDPFLVTMGTCGSLRAGGMCFAFLHFNDEQHEVVGIRSSRPGTPTVEHHIEVR